MKFQVLKIRVNENGNNAICCIEQDFLNGPVKDCVRQSYTDRFKTKRRFITKNANVAKLDSFIYCNP